MYRRLLGLCVLGAGLLALAGGCGPSYSEVKVKVTLDGAPLEGAGVSFVSDDTKLPQAYGVTDAQGIAVLATAQKQGVQAGTYKPLVTKTEGTKGLDENTGMTDPKQAMEKYQKDKGGIQGMPGAKKGPGGIPMPGAPGAGGGGSHQAKSLIPEKYALNKGDNPLAPVTVPASGMIELNLTSK